MTPSRGCRWLYSSRYDESVAGQLLCLLNRYNIVLYVAPLLNFTISSHLLSARSLIRFWVNFQVGFQVRFQVKYHVAYQEVNYQRQHAVVKAGAGARGERGRLGRRRAEWGIPSHPILGIILTRCFGITSLQVSFRGSLNIVNNISRKL